MAALLQLLDAVYYKKFWKSFSVVVFAEEDTSRFEQIREFANNLIDSSTHESFERRQVFARGFPHSVEIAFPTRISQSPTKLRQPVLVLFTFM